MTSGGPFQPQPFCDSVINGGSKQTHRTILNVTGIALSLYVCLFLTPVQRVPGLSVHVYGQEWMNLGQGLKNTNSRQLLGGRVPVQLPLTSLGVNGVYQPTE